MVHRDFFVGWNSPDDLGFYLCAKESGAITSLAAGFPERTGDFNDEIPPILFDPAAGRVEFVSVE